jgi:hypothetical protein
LLKLIVVVTALEEGLLVEDHPRHHHPQRPNIQRVMIVFIRNEKLWSLEITGAHSHVVVLLWKVEFTQTPVNNSQLNEKCFTFRAW